MCGPARRSFIALVLSLLAHGVAVAGEPELRAEAQRCASAMLAKDPDVAIPCMNPRLVEALGGVDAAKQTLARKRKQMDESGASFEGVTVGNPARSVTVNGREFVLIPEELRIRVKEGTVRQNAYMLAVRESGAKTWTFFDTAPALPGALAKLFPDTTAAEFEKIVIPPREAPVLEKPEQ